MQPSHTSKHAIPPQRRLALPCDLHARRPSHRPAARALRHPGGGTAPRAPDASTPPRARRAARPPRSPPRGDPGQAARAVGDSTGPGVRPASLPVPCSVAISVSSEELRGGAQPHSTASPGPFTDDNGAARTSASGERAPAGHAAAAAPRPRAAARPSLRAARRRRFLVDCPPLAPVSRHPRPPALSALRAARPAPSAASGQRGRPWPRRRPPQAPRLRQPVTSAAKSAPHGDAQPS